jgi:hypothetical protein
MQHRGGSRVYYNGEPVATAEEYAEQASQIASHGLEAKPPETEDWVALGVFAMVQGEEKDANDIFQLAVNKEESIPRCPTRVASTMPTKLGEKR